MELLKNEKNIIKQWGLVSYYAENRTLQMVASEVPIIYNNNANVRPGFEITGDTVFIPNLFVKISGRDDELSFFYNKEELVKRQDCFVYDSFESFCPDWAANSDIGSYIDDNMNVDKDRLVKSNLFPYSFLRIEYQNLLMSKINECLKIKNSIFTPGFGFSDDASVLSCLLSIDKNLIEAYNRFDFQYQPPAVIIYSGQKGKMHLYHGIQLILLNKLGFDIIIISPEGYSDIENIVNTDYYCIYYGDPGKIANRKKKTNYYAMAGVAVLICTAILVRPLFVKSGNLSDIEDRPVVDNKIDATGQTPITNGTGQTSANGTVLPKQPEIISEIQPKDVIDNKIDVTSQIPINGIEQAPTNQTVLPKQSPIIAEVQPKDAISLPQVPAKTETTITFSESDLESVIRKFTRKMDGPILQTDLDGLDDMYLVGIYVGMKDWEYIIGYSPDGYIDNERKLHTEEGYFHDLSGLKYLRNLKKLSVNWQMQLDISTLKDLTTLNSLTIIHDHIKSVESLSGYTELTELNVAFNDIADLSPLSKNTRLRFLDAKYNNIKDISTISAFKSLDCIILNSNPIIEASALKNFSYLRTLSLIDTQISDFRFLNEINNLESLMLAETEFSDLSVLKNMRKLRFLDISNTKVTDISILKELPSLQQVIMNGVKLKDTSILKELQGVEIIW